MQIACLGEPMIEFSGQPLARRFGGDTLNTALYLARLLSGHPTKIRYLSALGDDPLSDELRQAWQAEGILIDRLACLPGKLPGLYLVNVDAQGERSFLYWRNDSAARHYFAGELDYPALFTGIQALYLSGITLALFPAARRAALLQALAQFCQQGGQLWFDNNYRPALLAPEAAREAHEQVLALSHIALLTLEDECVLYGPHSAEAAIERTQALGCPEVVIKRGAQPCFIAHAGEQYTVAALQQVQVVDTCAAGDAFAAGYLASRSLGFNPRLAAHNAHTLSASVISHPGAIIPAAAMPPFLLTAE